MGGRGQRSGGEKRRDPQAALDELAATALLRARLRERQLCERYGSRRSGPLVSVLMPTWNRARVIARAIDSVLAQRYESFELIVVDDGSRDATGELIRERYGSDPRLLYLPVEHGGVSRARNVALARARGELVAYLDSDNCWSESYLLVMANLLADHPEARSAYCGVLIQDRIRGARSLLLRDYDRAALLERNFIDLNAFVHRWDLFRQRGGFRDDLPVLVDWELILRYTRGSDPLYADCVLATYLREEGLDHLTSRPDLGAAYDRVRSLHRE
jgi:glycosyltransferase involved in cell wall biosynthesis